MSEELEKAIEALKNPTLFTAQREAVMVYRDDLALVLERLEELEKLVDVLPDVVSELVVGDSVMSMIDYMDVKRGMTGKVARLCPSYEYPIEVQFEGTFFYNTTGVVGFKRDELGKVKA